MPEFRNIPIDQYRYVLPERAIAKYPLPGREDSKLLVYRHGEISHHHFKDILQLIPGDSHLVFNNTRVIQARLAFRKSSGARIEIFCLEPHVPADHQLAYESMEDCSWKCLVGNAKKWKEGSVSLECTVGGSPLLLEAFMEERLGDSFLVRFHWDRKDCSFGEIIDAAGTTPIPPYLNREAEEGDKGRYQTVYSMHPGSVAAPTAGLHFTDEILASMDRRGIRRSELTLHVGAGTFVPVKHEDAREHAMHEELVHVPAAFIREWASQPRELIAVGTTSTRSLESLYWLGVSILEGTDHDPYRMQFMQWDNEKLPGNCSLGESLGALAGFLKRHDLDALVFSTSLMIVPGYRFRAIRGLVTNFHMPGSTLLLLIAALIGEDWKKVYAGALENHYRFLSYGDSSLLLP